MRKPNDKPEFLGDVKFGIVCLAVCGIVMGCRILPSVINAISSLKSSNTNTKVVVDISSSNSGSFDDSIVTTTAPVTTTEETTTTPITTTVTTTTTTVTTTESYKVHILVAKTETEYTIYDVVWLRTFKDDNIEIIGYNEYRKLGNTKYYEFKTSTGEIITATQDSCYLVVEE